MDKSLDPRLRRGVTTCVKAVLMMHSQNANIALSDRCGAQGLFEYNQMSTLFNEVRGIAIASDILGLSIRFIADLLTMKYEIPPQTDPSSLLAKHELHFFKKASIKSHRMTQWKSS
ncbi:hypothetical protein M422DRAFT_253302 [Sphaerobolus stellatus SS14]|uniref:Acyl-CoA dehydrogenase/oxidase C-terminal domain-containing protein n=1 Tax=Sphaerobolus stellatus (strain SS14) TaxID=990650 RepID=A0A0C9VNA5_SPHS4|nr:hypothetical protein M422DRAFT_253302 [Sphaerobolus stellatus SS14]